MNALKSYDPIVVPDVEAIKDVYPEQYENYKRLNLTNIMGISYKNRSVGFLAMKNPKRYKDRPELLQLLSFVVSKLINDIKKYENVTKRAVKRLH